MAARFVVWLMLSVAAFCTMPAWPATTCPPVGSCVGAGGLGGAADVVAHDKASTMLAAASSTAPEARLPRPLAVSETATQVLVISL